MEDKYREDVEIDVDALEIEWIEQPMHYLKYSQKCNEARDRMDKAYQQVKVVEAGTRLAMREDPERFGLPKTTEGCVEDAARNNEEVIEYRNAYIEAQKEFNELLSVIHALETKKEALQNLVRLSQSDYFALSSEPRNIEEIKNKLKEVQENRARSKNEVMKKLNSQSE